MGKYYIYCNSNQLYHSLIHNAIYSSVLTKSDFVAGTPSFFSQCAIFVTKEKLSAELKAIGATDIYYPIVVEIEASEEGTFIPVHFVVKNEQVKVHDKLKSLCEYSDIENCIGAFVYGEIPISFVSAIFFDTEQDKLSFRKSSPDLWFPTELFHIIDNTEDVISTITKEDLRSAADLMNEMTPDEKCSELDRIIVQRNKQKAVIYYMIEATESWECGGLKANVDGYLVRTLDTPEKTLDSACKKAFDDLNGNCEFTYEEFIAATDPILESVEQQANTILFNKAMDYLYRCDDTTELNRKSFESIIKCWLDALDEKAISQAAKAALVIIDYVYTHTEMDPDKALDNLVDYPVLKALMFFLDQQKNGDFLRNTCKKLSPSEKRYAFMMFGAYHGMTEVDGARKKKRLLETRIEEIVLASNPSMDLISVLVHAENAIFCDVEKNGPELYSAVGIAPEMRFWYDCKTSQAKLMQASDETLEKIFKLMKDSTIPIEEIYALDEPVVVTVSFGGKEQRFELAQKAGIKGFLKDIEKTISSLTKQGEIFQAGAFRNYLSDSRRYAKFFKKNSDRIQKICGGIGSAKL